MSNLIKSVYFNVAPVEPRVIDSDSHIKEYLPDLQLQGEQEFVPFYSGNVELPDATEEYLEEMGLPEEDEVCVSPEQQEAANLLMEEAKEEAARILEEAEAQKEEWKQQAYEEGQQLGYAQGLAAAEKEMEEKKQELVKKEAMMEEEYQQQLSSLEPAFVDVVIKLIHKITGILIEDKKEILLYLIYQSIRQLEKPKSILLRVSKEDMLLVASKLETLKKAVAGDVEFDVVEEVTLTKNQCIIETDQKMFDCSLDAQLANLAEQLKLLSYS